MFNVGKRVVCPRCMKTVGMRQEEYRKEDRPVWGEKDYIEADFICSDCRRRMEEDIRKRAERTRDEI